MTSVVPGDDLGQAAQDLTRRLAAGPTASCAAIKMALLSAAARPFPAALEKEAELQARLGQTADHRAATMAFLRKERPSVDGR